MRFSAKCKFRSTFFTGVLYGSGQTWHEQRRFTLTTLRDFGFGKQSMEELVEEEAVELVNIVEEAYVGKPVDVQFLFNIKVLSSIWRIVAGKNLDHFDPDLLEACKLLNTTMREMFNPLNRVIINYPIIFNVLMMKLNLTPFGKTFGSLINLCEKDMKEHLQTYEDDYARDFIDAYISHAATSQEGSSFHGKNFELNLKNVLVDLFIAGSETTSTTLAWGVLFMVMEPDIQRRVQEELDAVVGRERAVKIADRPRLHYTNAVVHEIHRKADILFSAVPHAATEDSEIGQYCHKKNPEKKILLCTEGQLRGEGGRVWRYAPVTNDDNPLCP